MTLERRVIAPGVTLATLTPPETPDVAPELDAGAVVSERPPVPSRARPGYCSAHPDLRLVEPRRFRGWTGWDPRGEGVLCPDAEHTALDRERCTYCGRELHRLDPGKSAWRYSTRRTTCSPTCRNYLWRWLQASPDDRRRWREAMQQSPADPAGTVAEARP